MLLIHEIMDGEGIPSRYPSSAPIEAKDRGANTKSD